MRVRAHARLLGYACDGVAVILERPRGSVQGHLGGKLGAGLAQRVLGAVMGEGWQGLARGLLMPAGADAGAEAEAEGLGLGGYLIVHATPLASSIIWISEVDMGPSLRTGWLLTCAPAALEGVQGHRGARHAMHIQCICGAGGARVWLV